MKVRELLEQLKQENQDAEVVVEDYFNYTLIGSTVQRVSICERNNVNHFIRDIGHPTPDFPAGSVFLPVALLRTR